MSKQTVQIRIEIGQASCANHRKRYNQQLTINDFEVAPTVANSPYQYNNDLASTFTLAQQRIKKSLRSKHKQRYTLPKIKQSYILMTSERVTALPVMEKKHLVGIITETDYIRHITSKKVSAWSVKVEEIMSIGVITIGLRYRH